MKSFIFLFCTTVFSFSSGEILSQNAKVIIDTDKTITVDEVFKIIKNQTEYTFIYRSDLFKDYPKVAVKKGAIRANKLLQKSLSNGNFNIELSDNNTIVIKEKLKPIFIQQTISGLVTDENGQPLPGATVMIKGTDLGTSTDFDGKYNLTLTNNATALIVTFLGYKTTEVEINNRSTIDIQLQPDVAALAEVVLVGYGQVKREALTGSVGTVDIKNITSQAPTISLDNALQGQIAGVAVSVSSGQPGAAAKIRIRGNTSLLGNNQPLYVIDGIPISPNSNIPTGGNEGGGGLSDNLNKQGLSTPIGNINVSDIKSISVLKDASAAAIYGSRAANGVIIIKTKQGTYSGKTKFEFNTSIGTQNAKILDILNVEQYKQAWRIAVQNALDTGRKSNFFTNSVIDGSAFGNGNTNWREEISPGAPITTTYNISARGGSEKTRFAASLSTNKQEGVYKNTGLDRYTFNLSIDSKVKDYWTIGAKVNLSSSNQKSLDGSITSLIYYYRPDIPIFDEDGNYAYPKTLFASQNPVALSNATNENNTFLLLGSIYSEFELAEGLNFKTFFSLNKNDGRQQSYYPRYTGRGGFDYKKGNGNGYAQESRSQNINTLLQGTLTYDKVFGNHGINAVLGVSFEKNKNNFLKGWGEGFFNDVLTDISSAAVYNKSSSDESGSGLASYFGRVNYDYDGKYLLTVSARTDGSSKFGTDKQYAFFPAFAAAWRISNENFLSDASFIDELKLRASFGVTGQQDFGNYAWRTLFKASKYGKNPAIVVEQLGNKILKWETTEQTDFGLDFSFFNRRFSGSIGYYNKKTIDALYILNLPSSIGYSSLTANIGDTQNTGVELELKGDLIRSDNFKWNMSLNISKNENKLIKISDDLKDKYGYIPGYAGGKLKEGSPIGLIRGYVADGLYQTQAEIDALNAASPTGVYERFRRQAPGDIKFKDISGPDGVPDGIITSADQTVIGTSQPDFYGGLNSMWKYKGFSLSTFFTFSVGNDLEAYSYASNTSFGGFSLSNKTTDIYKAWSPDNRSSNLPRLVYGDPNKNRRTSSHFVYDASFIRLKTLNLGYDFPKETLKQLKFLDYFSIFVSASNLVTFTKYPGADPEASNLFGNDISSGRDLGGFPITKTFTAGIKIGF
ncbi:SusC/RagA family TonB-linked outer membrane protein [Polaribacter cellanae]|nr:TonB-dependent receptor [Polaribacter cellanae]